MKNKIFLFITIGVLMAGCTRDFLAAPPNNVNVTDSTVFSDEIKTRQFLANTYSGLPGNATNKNNGQLADGCFESEQGIQWSPFQVYNMGGYNPGVNNIDNAYGTYYTMIRKANLFIRNERYMTFNPQSVAYFKGENRFLRAFAYFELLKRYGGVPLIDSVSIFSSTDIDPVFRDNLERNSFAATVQFIVNDLDYAADRLPWIWPNANNDFGRATKSVCMAMKSRLLLYVASPLFNTNVSYLSDASCPDSLVRYPNYDVNRWKLAMEAAKAFLDSNQTNALKYALYNGAAANSYGDLFINVKGNAANREVIFSHPSGLSTNLSNPTLNLVDMYDMANGKEITDATSGYDPQDPYTGRDPRLKQTILTNGAPWNGTPFEVFIGGKDYNGDRTITFMLQKKYMGINGPSQNNARWIFYRLAEIYLNYAEAQNEYENGPSAASYGYINDIRARAGVNMPPLPSGLSKADFAARVKKERMLELAFEEHNIFDVRRWMMAETKESGKFEGFKITKTGTAFRYERNVFENRTFQKRFYLFPLPEAEIFKSPKLKQNPGWY
ncbi:RagB/SusD family nutrient uptake outer membrane protein [Chitinophaga sp. RAB17]|uniref:RagB/SusD family nutrient uptake outer membrane protein n=1 Tax=Chitinophaga sp. RAB17 TaxID=3233049 RepID=UPI003F9087DC